VTLTAVLVLGGCDMPAVLDPHGPGAASIATLTWIMTIVLSAVGIITLAILAYALLHRRRNDAVTRDDAAAVRWIVIGGIIAPAVILVGLFVVIMTTLGALARTDPDALTIEVTGRQWWWRIDYRSADPSLHVITANEIHIPVGQRVELILASDDVIHSFWVPQLQGKTDLIPGRRNRMWVQADTAGVYSGWCAEFCGLQHAHMRLLVVAEPAAGFEAWLARQRRPAEPPADPIAARGERAFLTAGCAVCHTIRGTDARGTAGPDLTHLGSRRTLAAGTLPNTPGHLGGWIADPQRIKPGNLMPGVALPAADLPALITYLESLR
jgi:cytochrome c oxidase subunit 2